MLTIKVQGYESYDSVNNEFIVTEDTVLNLEHSLVSISKWESKWKKPFLNVNNDQKTDEESIDYIRCMLIDESQSEVVNRLSSKNVEIIAKYIQDSMTATTIRDDGKKGSRSIVTSEVIYYKMIALNIPFECQYWHINRLLTLISVCNAYNSTPKKMSSKELMSRNAAINAARRKANNSSG